MHTRDLPNSSLFAVRDGARDAGDDAAAGFQGVGDFNVGAVASPAMRRGNLVVVLEDQPGLSGQVSAICGYVGLNVEPVASIADLGLLLDERRPLALIAPFETEHQDGGHILKSVALHDPDLPVMLLTGRNPIYQGAAEAMREILKLTAVSLPEGEPSLGQMVEFLARASQRNRRRRLSLVENAPEEGEG